MSTTTLNTLTHSNNGGRGPKVRVAVVGVGNCASSLIQGVHFYADAFGPTVTLHSPYWSELVVAGATVALHPGRTGGDRDTGLGFEVDDLDAALATATSLDGRVVDPPRDRAAEGIRIAQLADTEGNIISVAEPSR